MFVPFTFFINRLVGDFSIPAPFVQDFQGTGFASGARWVDGSFAVLAFVGESLASPFVAIQVIHVQSQKNLPSLKF